MALLSRIKCRRCGKLSDESHSASQPAPDVCSKCEQMQLEGERSKHLCNCARMTVEERLTRIEAQLYDQKKENEAPQWDGRIG